MFSVCTHINITKDNTASPSIGFGKRAPSNQIRHSKVRKLVRIGQQAKYGSPYGMISFKCHKKHYNQMVISGKLLYIPFGIMFLRYFSNLTFVNGLLQLIKYWLSAKIFTFTHIYLFVVVN